ncbi:hypothetical protein Patl1_32809 [Pistacia atlantica]|uniref:Uncharacterized protein n=1 Tax=Pistacia atlantica TaxID=434234 RepID=A0ACC1AR14_9ROSI|nr:hypothetical protein Patl1_32809 [Pistacia atlantica]
MGGELSGIFAFTKAFGAVLTCWKAPCCKIVYICRKPKDSFVSLWHFTRKLRPGKQEPMSLEETFELFCKGVCDYGPCWDHLSGYWKGSLEQPEKILFQKYEEVVKDTPFYVKRLAEFMGYPFSVEEEKEGKIQDIVEFCSFENMRNLEVSKTGNYPNSLIENKTLFRKGEIGDWKNYLTPEMAKQLDKITEQKLEVYGLSFHSP